MKKFLIQAACLAAVVALLFGYNSVIPARKEAAEAAGEAESVDLSEEESEEESEETPEDSEEEDSMASEDSESETEEAEPATYTDGTYQGTAEGYGGDVTVEVTVEGGSISSISVLSAKGEDAGYFNMAKEVIQEILDAQSVEVDAVSGATYSSEAIKNAVSAALEGAAAQEAGETEAESADAEETESAESSGDLQSGAEESESGDAAAVSYVDGTYQGTAEGYGGDVTVEVTVEGGSISSISVLSAKGEDAGYFNMAKEVIQEILDAQSVEVDAVSGATYSSEAIKNAVAAALEGAEG